MSRVEKKLTPAQQEALRVKTLAKHLIRGNRNNTCVKFAKKDDTTLYFIYKPVDTGVAEIDGGEYIGEAQTRKGFPFTTPDVLFYTPTGVFPIHSTDYCTTAGGRYHAGDYKVTLGVDGYTLAICEALLQWPLMSKGINLTTGVDDAALAPIITQYSRDSKNYNRINHPDVIALFDQRPE
jgi:hypothetical protein